MARSRIAALLLFAALAAADSAHAMPPQHGQGIRCRLDRGPRAGQVIDVSPLPLGQACGDGRGSMGIIVSPQTPYIAHHAMHHHAMAYGVGPAPSARGVTISAQDQTAREAFEGGATSAPAAEAPAPPPPPPPPPVSAAPPPVPAGPPRAVSTRVSQITPYYWKRHQPEPPAPFYFYLLFGQASPPSVQLAALRAVICDLHRSPTDLPTTLPRHEAPLLLPVVNGFNARIGVQPTEAQLVRFRNESYDGGRAQNIIGRMGLSPGNVYLLASRRPIRKFPKGAAVAANADYRAVYVDRTHPYEGIALRSIIAEAYEGTLFDGQSSRDVGYAMVSFVYRLGSVVATVIPSASAATNPAARDDRGVCEADD
ncbi:MAG TPA: hypothetical protein VGM17_04335 [Rhizomicrobium sp.]|jgi:hypothetical protein